MLAAAQTVARLRPVNHGSHFRAYGLHGDDVAGLIDPFLGVDHAWMGAPTFAPHPHAGFSAVSYVFLDAETGIANRDSLGGGNLIQPGGLLWTAAGRGVLHDEVPAERGKTTHLLQIFVNLPQARQDEAPFTLSLAPLDVPTVHGPGTRVRVPLGGYGEVRSPLRPPTDVTLLDVSLEDEAQLALPVPAGEGAFVIPIFGSLCVEDEPIGGDAPRAPIFEAQAAPRTVTLRACRGPAKAVLFSGAPLRQPVYRRGPITMASPEALDAAVAAFERGAFGRL